MMAMRATRVWRGFATAKAPKVVKDPKAPRVMKEVQLSPELSELVKATTLTRPQALKALWAYIKESDIKKNETGQYITSAPLQPIIGKATFKAPDVMKALSKHLTKIE